MFLAVIVQLKKGCAQCKGGCVGLEFKDSPMPLVFFWDLSGHHAFRFIVGLRGPLLCEAYFSDHAEQGLPICWFSTDFLCFVLELNDANQGSFFRLQFDLDVLSSLDRPCCPVDLWVKFLKERES